MSDGLTIEERIEIGKAINEDGTVCLEPTCEDSLERVILRVIEGRTGKKEDVDAG